jgi:hypothetical protein
MTELEMYESWIHGMRPSFGHTTTTNPFPCDCDDAPEPEEDTQARIDAAEALIRMAEHLVNGEAKRRACELAQLFIFAVDDDGHLARAARALLWPKDQDGMK